MLLELIGIAIFPLVAEECDVIHQQLGSVSHILSPGRGIRLVVHIVGCVVTGSIVSECTSLTVAESEELEGMETAYVLGSGNGLVVFVVVTFPGHAVPLL